MRICLVEKIEFEKILARTDPPPPPRGFRRLRCDIYTTSLHIGIYYIFFTVFKNGLILSFCTQRYAGQAFQVSSTKVLPHLIIIISVSLFSLYLFLLLSLYFSLLFLCLCNLNLFSSLDLFLI